MEDISWNHSLKAQASLSHIRTHSVVVLLQLDMCYCMCEPCMQRHMKSWFRVNYWEVGHCKYGRLPSI